MEAGELDLRKIYIVLTHTGTLLSRLIKIFTKDEFSHSSIALDLELKQMYSFGRLDPNNPFIGGFVHEFMDKGTFKKFYNTKAKIYSLTITEAQYKKVKNCLAQVEKQKKNYKFNIIGLFLAGMNIRRKKEHAFYCAEFVKYVLENAGIDTGLPESVKPEDFRRIKELKEVYAGYLRQYSSKAKITKWIPENLSVYQKIGNF